MKNALLFAGLALTLSASAQFKDQLVVHGITYNVTDNSPSHATYVQQDFKDFSLAADSFYIDVMTETQWDAYVKLIVAQEGATWENDMYHTNNGCQVFVGEHRSKHTGNLLIYRLFGSKDEE